MRNREDNDGVRWQIVLRTTLLFGEERAIANREEIEAAAAAIDRLRRLRAGDFASLDSEKRA